MDQGVLLNALEGNARWCQVDPVTSGAMLGG